MNDLISREEVIKCIESRNERLMHDEEYRKKRGDIDLLGIIPSIHVIPSVDIMECARAIKSFCSKQQYRCASCKFQLFDEEVGVSVCGLEVTTPLGWDLPEGEKGLEK